MTIYQLNAHLRSKIHPDVMLTIGRMEDQGTWSVDGGTPEQRSAAQAVLDAFDPAVAQAEISAEAAAEAERQTFLRQIKGFYQNEFLPLRAWARTKGYPG